MEKFYITTPIYYASGEPHIGHSLTTIAADIISRYQKLKNKKVFFATGMDEHGSKIAERALSKNKDPQKYVDEIAEQYIKTWNTLNIQYSDFIRTTSEKHKQGVINFLKRIQKAGDIYESLYEGLYCVDCEKFIAEKDLINNLCPDHLKTPQLLKEKNFFFNLKKYLPEIKKLITNNIIKIIPESRKNEILNIIDSNIPDFSISREKVKWGIPLPFNEQQTIYVWTEALMNYITILDFPDGENFKTFWPADLHIIGADISKFHCIFWPALLLSADLSLPKNIFIHGFLTIDGQKISKTIGNVINPLAIVEKFGSDATRYLIISQFRMTEHGDVKIQEFTQKYNSDLANGLGNLLERIFRMIIKYNIKINENNIDKEKLEWIKETEEKYNQYMENFLLFDALQNVFVFIKKLDGYINEKTPWKLADNNSQKLEGVLNFLFKGTQKIILWLTPFLPEKSLQAQQYINRIQNQQILNDEKLNLFPRIT
jgi:methionyl-tRNA synthetase